MEMNQSFYERLMSTQHEMMNQLRLMQTNQMTMQQALRKDSTPGIENVGLQTGQATSTEGGQGIDQQMLSGTFDQPSQQISQTMLSGTLDQQSPNLQQAQGTMSQQPNMNGPQGNPKGFLDGTVFQGTAFNDVASDMVQSRSYLMGGEAMQQHQTDIRQKMQLGTLNAMNGTLGTAVGVGSFLAPGGLIASSAIGLGAGAVVAYGADKVMDGARDALSYQRILEEKGYKAFNVFEGRNDFGGIGMNLSQQQDLSSYMRDLAPDKLLKDEEISKILDGALDGKLLKSSTDIKSFKKKFSDIVDSVKEVAVVMNASLDEATKMLGELETRGINASKATMLTSQAKVNASLQGIGADKAFEQTLNAADTLTLGSGMSGEKAMTDVGISQYVTSNLYEQYKTSDPALYNYIKNNGGESAIATMGAQTLQHGLSRQSPELLISQLGFAAKDDGTGNITLDMEKVGQLTRGELGDAQAIQQLSNANLNQLKPGQRDQFVKSVGEMTKQQLGSADNAAVLRNLVELQSKKSGQTPEMTLMDLNLAGNPTEAAILIDQIYNTTGASVDEFAALSTREGLAAIKRVNSPSIFAEVKAGWAKNVTNPLGDIGQFVTDEVGSMTLSLQKSIHNVDADGNIRSDKLVKADEFYDRVYDDPDSLAAGYEKGLQSFFESSAETKEKVRTSGAQTHVRGTTRQRQHQRDTVGELTDDAISRYTLSKGTTSSEGMSAEEFHLRMEKAVDGSLSLGDLAELRTGIKDGTYSGNGKERAQALVQLTTGETDFNDLDLNALLDGKMVKMPGGDKLDETFNGKGTIGDFEKDFSERAEKLAEKKRKALDKAYEAAKTLDLSKEDASALHGAIYRGDHEGAKLITGNADVLKHLKDADGYTKKLAEGRDLSGGLSGILDNTSAKTDAVGMSIGLLVESKAMSKKDAEILFSDAIGSADSIDKGIKNKDWSVEKIRDETKLLDDRYKGAFNSLSDAEIKKYAQSIADFNMEDSYTMDAFMQEGGTIDREKVINALPNIISSGSTDGSASIDPSKGVSKELSDHKDAMGGLLETISEETKMVKDATKHLKNGLPYQYTSVM